MSVRPVAGRRLQKTPARVRTHPLGGNHRGSEPVLEGSERLWRPRDPLEGRTRTGTPLVAGAAGMTRIPSRHVNCAA
ncbi:hypothetical protein STEG23_022024 [Scotinomys teguina]